MVTCYKIFLLCCYFLVVRLFLMRVVVVSGWIVGLCLLVCGLVVYV